MGARETWDFPGVSEVKNLPAMQDPQVRSLGREDPLEEGMATHPVRLQNPTDREPGGLQSL